MYAKQKSPPETGGPMEVSPSRIDFISASAQYFHLGLVIRA